MTLQIPGAPNFRDLGGYTGQDGRQVRRGRLFRSDHLGALGEADLPLLRPLLGPSPRVCDLRGVAERQAAPCVLAGAQVHSLPIEPTVVQRLTSLLAAGHALTEDDTVALMQDTYRGFVRGNTHRFAALFGHLLDAQDAPLVFHCTAGKDRTGFAAALVLSALGVEQRVILDDFLLTNERLKDVGHRSRSQMPAPVALVLHTVRREFLDAALQAVQEDFGSLDTYLAKGIGLGALDRAQLQRLYLAPEGSA